MSSRFPASLIAMLVGLTATSFGEEPLPSHTLLGTVTDTHAASLAGVTVELSNQAPTLQPLIPGTRLAIYCLQVLDAASSAA